MPIVLVHGGWHGGWCWDRVRSRLPSTVRSFAPTLKGLAERSDELYDGLDLEEHVRDVVTLLESNDLSDVILCGHSYGGAVVTRVADEVGERLRAIVYLDAFAPRNGETILGLREGLQLPNKAALDVPPAEHFGLVGADAEYVASLMTPHPAATLTQAVRIRTDQPAQNVAQRMYVLATGWDAPPHFRERYEIARADPGWRTEIIEGSHDLMVDRPDDVVRVLMSMQSAETHEGD